MATPVTIPPTVAADLLAKHGPIKIIPGEVCHETPNECFKMVTNNYGEVLDGVAIQSYKQTRTMDGVIGVITSLLLPPKTRVGLGRAYSPSANNSCEFSLGEFHEHKCRASEAVVLKNDFYNVDLPTAKSNYDSSFLYQKGQTVTPSRSFHDQGCFAHPHQEICNQHYYETCHIGVHFFLRKGDAKDYTF
jgi:hypothetical protein